MLRAPTSVHGPKGELILAVLGRRAEADLLALVVSEIWTGNGRGRLFALRLLVEGDGDGGSAGGALEQHFATALNGQQI